MPCSLLRSVWPTTVSSGTSALRGGGCQLTYATDFINCSKLGLEEGGGR